MHFLCFNLQHTLQDRAYFFFTPVTSKVISARNHRISFHAHANFTTQTFTLFSRAISINVARSKLQAYATRPNGSVGRSRSRRLLHVLNANKVQWLRLFFFYLFRHVKTNYFNHSKLKRKFAIKTTQGRKKSYGNKLLLSANTFTLATLRLQAQK